MTSLDHLPTVTYSVRFISGPAADFQVERFSAEEGVNRCYRVTIDVTTEELDLQAGELLGADCEVTLQRLGFSPSFFCGIVSRIAYLGRRGHRLGLRVTAISAFELAKQRVRSRIWQSTSVQDIVKAVLDEAFADHERSVDFGSISRGGAARDYCVQYRESDHDFVCRLLEEEGISWFFIHDGDQGKELMTLADDNAQYLDVENTDQSSVIPLVDHNPDEGTVEAFERFELTQCLTSTAAGRTDFDLSSPSDIVLADHEGEDERGRVRRVYDHGQRRFVTDDLATRAQDLAEAMAMAGAVATASGNPTAARPGRVFMLEDMDLEFEDGQGMEEWLLTRAWHDSSADGDVLGYRARFECIPKHVPLRPYPRTPKPRVGGPQTATVVGGGEIDVDDLGRIEVQFHWEEGASFGAGASCRVRCAQSWAGPGWGAQFIPRVGMEVVVEFLEGNPDRPLVTGCVYNGSNAPPFALPGDSTQSGLRTNSSPGGGGSNELRFEDAAGAEEIYIHAQKDKTIAIENDRSMTIGNDESCSVGHDRQREVGNDEALVIGANRNITVGSKFSEGVGADMVQTIGANQTITVGADRAIAVGANQNLQIASSSTELVGTAKTVTIGAVLATTVGAAMNTTVGAACSEEIGGLKSVSVGANSSEEVGGAKTLSAATITDAAKGDFAISAGANLSVSSKEETAIKADKDFSVEGKKKGHLKFEDELTITVGKAKITMKKNGDVVIEGGKISVDGSKSVILKGKKVLSN